MTMIESFRKCWQFVTRKKNYKPKNLVYFLLFILSFPFAFYFTSGYDAIIADIPPIPLTDMIIAQFNISISQIPYTYNKNPDYFVLKAIVSPKNIPNLHFNWTFGDGTVDQGGPVIGHQFPQNISKSGLWAMVSGTSNGGFSYCTAEHNIIDTYIQNVNIID